MSGVRGSSKVRATVRMRHAEAGVVSEMARSLHREARSERERAGESVRVGESMRTREIVCTTEAASRVRSRHGLTARPRRAAAIA
jgi:hypothetical protein